MSILMFLQFIAQMLSGLHYDTTVVVTPPPAVVAPAPAHHQQQHVNTHAPVVTPTHKPAPTPKPAPVEQEPMTPQQPEIECAPGEESQGEFGCVAVQLPEETDGRQYD
jgi:hypothetical protein